MQNLLTFNFPKEKGKERRRRGGREEGRRKEGRKKGRKRERGNASVSRQNPNLCNLISTLIKSKECKTQNDLNFIESVP